MSTPYQLQKQIDKLKAQVRCLQCCDNIIDVTTLSPPIEEPLGNDPIILYNESTGEIWGWDGVGWVILNAGGTDTNLANTDLVFSADRSHDLAGFRLTLLNVLEFIVEAVAGGSALLLGDGGKTYVEVGTKAELGYQDIVNNIIRLNGSGINLLSDNSEYFMNTPPTLDDATSTHNLGIDNATGRIYRTTKVSNTDAQNLDWVDSTPTSKFLSIDNATGVEVLSGDGIDLTIPLSGSLQIDVSENVRKDQFGITIDGGGSTITTGGKGRIVVPYDGTITGWTILEISDTPITSSIVVDVKAGTYANYDTTPTFTSIAGTEKPTITTSEKGQDLSLSTWTTAVTAGTIIDFSVDSVTDAEKILVLIHTIRT